MPMTVQSQTAMQQGGVTILVFHCVFNGDGSITHFMHDYDDKLYKALPNLYAVCMADNTGRGKRLVAGFVVKTTYGHEDADFVHALESVVASNAGLKVLRTQTSSFLPARLGVPGEAPLSEQEMLSVMVKQALKHGAVGSA